MSRTRWSAALVGGGSLAAVVAAWLRVASLPPPLPLPLAALPAPERTSSTSEPTPTPAPTPLIGAVRVTSGVAIQPVSYAWAMAGEDELLDRCAITLSAPAAVGVNVYLYYRHPGTSFVRYSNDPPVAFVAGQQRTVTRFVPVAASCPCLVCVEQNCPQGWTHTQCGVVLQPGDALPLGWTPFSQLAAGAAPCAQPVVPSAIFSDGFESGGTKRWA